MPLKSYSPRRTRRQLVTDWLLAFGFSIVLWCIIAGLGWCAFALIKAMSS